MNDQNLVQEFLLESHENLEQLDRDLVALEAAPGDRDLLDRIFRTVHTLKGSCGFFGFARLAALSHHGEGLLSRLREGTVAAGPAVTSALLALGDAVRAVLGDIRAGGAEGERDHTALLATLTALTERGQRTEDRGQKEEGTATDGLSSVLCPLSSGLGDGLEGSLRVDVGRLDRLMNLVGELVLARNQLLQFTAARSDPAFLGTAQRLNQITTELQEGIMKTRMQPISTLWNKLPRVARDLARACGKQVEIDLAGADTELDKAIIETIKGPLAHLVRNAIDHGIEAPELRTARGKPAAGWLSLRAYHEGGLVHLEVGDDGGGIDVERVRRKALALGLIAPEEAAALDEGGLLGLIFLPGLSTAESVSNVSGRGVGMDVVKTNIEKLGGTVEVQSRPGRGTTFHVQIPLTLAIIPALIVTCAGDRYAVPQASLLELVRLEGEQARRGVEPMHGGDVYRLRDKLLPLVYLDRQLQAPSPQPLSPEGRGVGGEGGLCSGLARCAVPALSRGARGPAPFPRQGEKSHQDEAQADDGQWVIPESDFSPRPGEVTAGAGVPPGRPGPSRLAPAGSKAGEGRRPDVQIVVLQAGDRQFGLVVDGTQDTEEIVVKPLGRHLKGVPLFAGATILGDGQVVLILDVLGLARSAGVVADASGRTLAERAQQARQRGSARPVLLLAADGRRLAVPLESVARLEELPAAAAERAGRREVTQYRGRILPLVRFGAAPAGGALAQMVVCGEPGRQVGLVVDRILDVTEAPADADPATREEGTLGAAVIGGQVTELLDVPALARAAGGRD